MNHERFQVIFLSQGAHFGTLRAAQIVGRPLARTGRKNLKCTAAQTIGPFGCILNPSCNRCVNADPAGGAVRRSFRPREFENVLFAGDGAGHNDYKCKCAPCLSASPRRDMRSSILLPACLIGLVADRVQLAPSFGEYDLVRRNSIESSASRTAIARLSGSARL